MRFELVRSVTLGLVGGGVAYVVIRRLRASLVVQADTKSEQRTGGEEPAPFSQSIAVEPTTSPEKNRSVFTPEEVQVLVIGIGTQYAISDIDIAYAMGLCSTIATEFAMSHPGGPELVYQCAGRDATFDFLSVHPPEYAWEYVGPAIGTVQTELPKEMPPAGLAQRPEEAPSFKTLRTALRDQVLTVTGGFGAMVQRYMREEAMLSESDYRSCPELEKHPEDLFGNHDVLALTRPDVVAWVYQRMMEACNVVGTSTFNTQRISQEEYGIGGDLVYAMAKRSAALAQQIKTELGFADRFVGGQIGPTTKTACVAIDVMDPSLRNTTFDELAEAYKELVAGMVDGGVDIVMIDCAFDTLNVKAALYAMDQVFTERRKRIPVMVSMSLVDDSGRTLSGQTVEAFYASIRHARPMTVGFNCGAGPEQMARYLERLSAIVECFTHAYPNAGLPNAEGCYDLAPAPMAAQVAAFAREQRSNVVGGCCGAGHTHLRAITDSVAGLGRPAAASSSSASMTSSATSSSPASLSLSGRPCLRVPSDTNTGGQQNHFDRALYPPGVAIPARRPAFLLSGTEELVWRRGAMECCRVVMPALAELQGPGWGSGGEQAAVARLRAAVREEGIGCLGLHVCMRRRGAEAGAWSDADVVRFANLVQGEPELSQRPLLVHVEPLDAQGQATLVKLLKCLQGRSLVDLGSLFSEIGGGGGGGGASGCIPAALVDVLNEVRCLGNSVLLDAPSSDLRAAALAFEALGFERDEVVFAVPHNAPSASADASADGIVTAIRVDAAALPQPRPAGASEEEWGSAIARAHVRRKAGGAALVVGPASGRGAGACGCTAEAEAAVAAVYAHAAPLPLSLPLPGDTGRIERAGAASTRSDVRQSSGGGDAEAGGGEVQSGVGVGAGAGVGVGGEEGAEEKQTAALRKCVEEGIDTGLAEAVEMAVAAGHTVDSLVRPLSLKPQPDSLLDQRAAHGSDGQGQRRLLQVLKSSRVLKLAVTRLQGRWGGVEPREKEVAVANRGVGEKVVLATVKGDVHDLGKTIVGILLRCNGYNVVDLGRNVELEAIASEALGETDGVTASMIGLSGMISPSLGRMAEAVAIFRDRGLGCPVLVGGSATSSAFCARFLDTLSYPGGVFRIADGPRTIMAAASLLRSPPELSAEWAREQQDKYEELREQRVALKEKPEGQLPLADARAIAAGLRRARFPPTWTPFQPAPSLPVGVVVEESFSVAHVLPLVNWTYFFQVFNLQGRHPHHTWPALLQDPRTGAQARSLQADLDRLIAQLPPDAVAVRCVHGLFPARAVGDDIHVSCACSSDSDASAARGEECVVVPMLRQQTRECLSIADFVSEGEGDHVGVFACACPLGEGAGGEAGDEYQQVLLKALAARLVEAGVELLHHRIRRGWYESEATTLTAEAMLQEKYDGIRPAVGYPSMPDQRLMGAVWDLLGMPERADRLGMSMTESFGLSPEASIAGIMLSHPASSYFSIGRASHEQVEDYASRVEAAALYNPHATLHNGATQAADRAVAETNKWLVSVL